MDDPVSEVGAGGHDRGSEGVDDALHQRSAGGLLHVLRVAGQRPRVLEVPVRMDLFELLTVPLTVPVCCCRLIYGNGYQDGCWR